MGGRVGQGGRGGPGGRGQTFLIPRIADSNTPERYAALTENGPLRLRPREEKADLRRAFSRSVPRGNVRE